jgi:hypothetical protein
VCFVRQEDLEREVVLECPAQTRYEKAKSRRFCTAHNVSELVSSGGILRFPREEPVHVYVTDTLGTDYDKEPNPKLNGGYNSAMRTRRNVAKKGVMTSHRWNLQQSLRRVASFDPPREACLRLWPSTMTKMH